MEHVRHADRHVEASVVTMLRTFLKDYAWLGPGPAPYGAKPFTFHVAEIHEEDLVPARANAVFFALGPRLSPVPMQLGGGILRDERIVFIDVLADSKDIGLAITNDITDRLNGLFGGTSYIRPVNQQTGVPLPGYVGEFRDVFVEQPRPEVAVNFFSVKASLFLDYPGGS